MNKITASDFSNHGEHRNGSAALSVVPVIKTSTAPKLCTVTVSEVTLDVVSRQPIDFIDLTDHINACLSRFAISDGSVMVFSRHTTAAIRINEAEELLMEDLKRMLARLCPPHDTYDHNDMSRRKPPIAPDERPNAHSHCMHLLLSTSETIPVVDGWLAFGRWQRVFMVDLDGPRRREVHLRFTSYVEQAAQPQLEGQGGTLRRILGPLHRNGTE